MLLTDGRKEVVTFDVTPEPLVWEVNLWERLGDARGGKHSRLDTARHVLADAAWLDLLGDASTSNAGREGQDSESFHGNRYRISFKL